jgi:lipopolysaccharide transport system ATP-binding protein
MRDAVIRVEGLGKEFVLGRQRARYRTLRETITNLASRPFQSREAVPRTARRAVDNRFWALRDLSFDVTKGEVVGIVGRNGAGKSTLLKILSRITEPTEGFAVLRGRVGSLLEVGTGFHPELSGRDNIYLNGAIIGMKRREIRAKFDEIVAFAEVERFVDTQVKHYSSGMGLRLGFAIAAHLQPEILVVDEVLAVGDAAFQKKCLGKMEDVAHQGRTVLFVSHNMGAVKSLCHRGLLLESGRLVRSGPIDEIVEEYLGGHASAEHECVWTDPSTAPGNDKARLRAVRISSAADGQNEYSIAKPLTLQVEYEVLESDTILNLSASVYNQENSHVFASTNLTDSAWYARPHPTGRYRSQCVIPANLLNAGRYIASILLVERANQVIAQADKVVSVDMIDLGEYRGGYYGHWGGIIKPLLDWKTEPIA